MHTPQKNRAFPNTTTVWTLIRHAGNPAEPRAQQAFAALYELYAYPLYAQLRAWGRNHHDAEDLLHDFFLYANEHRLVGRNEPDKGRFRTFIVTCLRNFMRSETRRADAARHGSRKHTISFDGMAAEARYAAEPVDLCAPDKILEGKLALQVGHQALLELEAEAIAAGKGELYAALAGYLGVDVPMESYRALAVRLNQPAGTLKAQASVWRRRLREIFEAHVEPLVDNPADVPAEIIALEDALSDKPTNPNQASSSLPPSDVP
jgi:DNA-directed RNA polymerase specialized sigma24 family protein